MITENIRIECPLYMEWRGMLGVYTRPSSPEPWHKFHHRVFFMWCHAVVQHCGFYSNGNQYSFMQASFYMIVHNGFFSICGSSAWWLCTRMVHMTALDVSVILRNPTAMLGGQQDNQWKRFIAELFHPSWHIIHIAALDPCINGYPVEWE